MSSPPTTSAGDAATAAIACAAPPPSLHILYTSHGDDASFTVPFASSVAGVKSHIDARLGIPAYQLTLTWGGQELEGVPCMWAVPWRRTLTVPPPGRTLESYGIAPGAWVA
jgi:hypothetical protein